MPLAGVRVLDFSRYAAGPFCTRLLAEYGADVVKVEQPGTGDPVRKWQPFANDIEDQEHSLVHLHVNAGKRSVTLNLATAEGQRIARTLAGEADILVESSRPGKMREFGLSYEEIREINPALLYVSISNFGQTGPYRDYESSELIAYAMGGPMHATGHIDREPLKLAGNITQYQAGAVAAYATMAGLWRAEDTGEGDHVDVSLYEAAMGSRDRRTVHLTAYAYTGSPSKRVTDGVSLGSGFRPTADGYIMLAGYGKRLPSLLRLIGREDLLEDPRTATPSSAVDPEYVDEVETSYVTWSASRQKAEALREAQEQHLVGASLNTVADLFTDPHFSERAPWEDVDHPAVGAYRAVGRPFQMSGGARRSGMRAPLLGEHTDEVLHGELGFSREEIAELRSGGVI